MRKNILIVIFLIAGFAGGTIGSSIILFPQITDADNNRDYWYNQYNDLLDDYNNLAQNYGDLLADYNILVSDYADLFGEYVSILSVLEDPLTAPVLPTRSEVISWLDIDDTDTFAYTSVWMCGDFSAMLMTRAKEMNWRMRIVVVSFSVAANTTYGVSTPFGAYGHALNLIYVQDGVDADSNPDVLYIEPQNDNWWFVPNIIGGNYLHYWHYVSDIWGGTTWIGGLAPISHWINYYNYFG